MKKNKQSPLPKSIDQFEFHIFPLSLSCPKSPNASFYIYVEKGAQVIGKIDEPVRPSTRQFRFDPCHIKRFRVANQRHLTYNWSLYRLTTDNEEEYVQSIPFNIKNHFENYIKEFEKSQNDLYRIYYEKEKKTDLEQIWKDLRHDLKSEVQVSSIFSKLNVKLTFKIKINCEYDFMYQRWQQQKQKKKYEKKSSITRKASSQSKTSIFKTSSEHSLPQFKQKNVHSPTLPSKNLIKQDKNPLPNQEKIPQNYDKTILIGKDQQKQEFDNLGESEIRITSPEGIDLTMEIPEKFLNNRKAMEDEFYYRKKTSMLSDIIEQSYEGSSNANLIKSNQGERLKSVDIIHEEEQPMFSPMIKTQTFESDKHAAYFNDIKRTATLAHKHSQEFELEESPKASSKKMSQYANRSGILDHYNEKEKINSSPNIKTSGRSSIEVEEQEKEVTVDYSEAKKLIIKNAIKIFLIVVLLVIAVNIFSIFDRRQLKNYQTRASKKESQRKEDKPEKQTKQKPTKTKF